MTLSVLILFDQPIGLRGEQSITYDTSNNVDMRERCFPLTSQHHEYSNTRAESKPFLECHTSCPGSWQLKFTAGRRVHHVPHRPHLQE